MAILSTIYVKFVLAVLWQLPGCIFFNGWGMPGCYPSKEPLPLLLCFSFSTVSLVFYLNSVFVVHISFFLESWANPDFQPTFKVKRWIGLIGFIACFAVMFKLDMMAMIAALAVISAMYFGLQRKEVKLQTNDVWKSVWENVVNKGLKKIDAQGEDNFSWNPNIILFSGKSDHQKYLLELLLMTWTVLQ